MLFSVFYPKETVKEAFKTLEILEGEREITITTITTLIIIIEWIPTIVSEGKCYSFKQRRELRYREKYLTWAPSVSKSQGQRFNKNC